MLFLVEDRCVSLRVFCQKFYTNWLYITFRRNVVNLVFIVWRAQRVTWNKSFCFITIAYLRHNLLSYVFFSNLNSTVRDRLATNLLFSLKKCSTRPWERYIPIADTKTHHGSWQIRRNTYKRQRKVVISLLMVRYTGAAIQFSQQL